MHLFCLWFLHIFQIGFAKSNGSSHHAEKTHVEKHIRVQNRQCGVYNATSPLNHKYNKIKFENAYGF